MSLKLKKCLDCGKFKRIGKTKNRCKECRVADPTKLLNRPPGSATKK